MPVAPMTSSMTLQMHSLSSKPILNEIFNDCIRFQLRSKELVVYSISAKRIVTIAWPTHNSIPIQPSGIRDWLRARGLHWVCFCAMLLPEGQTCSTRIVGTNAKRPEERKYHVYCGSNDDCGFHIDLNETLETSTLRSPYNELPTRASGAKPNLDIPLCAFRSRLINDTQIGDYFEGYGGEHISHYPDVEQKCGERLGFIRSISRAEATASIALGPYYVPPELIPPPRPTHPVWVRPCTTARYNPYSVSVRNNSPAQTRIRRLTSSSTSDSISTASNSNSVASASTVSVASTLTGPSVALAMSELSRREQELMEDFVQGRGIIPFDWERLSERCGLCGEIFIASRFAVHSTQCRTIEIEDSD